MTSFLWFSPGEAGAQEAGYSRTILAIFDSTEERNPSADLNDIHKYAEMPLNYLGMKIRFHDVNEGLPEDEAMKGVRGILTWFADERMKDAEAYCRWAHRQIKAGKRYVMFGNFGAMTDAASGKEVPATALASVYEGLGLQYESEFTDEPWLIGIAQSDPGMTEFERSLEGEIEYYEKVRPAVNGVRPYLTLDRTDLEDGRSAAVAVTPNGGIVLEGYAVFVNHYNGQARWRINPFRFFDEAFGLKGRPRLDTTTLLGRRIFYAHIDGDGFRNLARFDSSLVSGAVVRKEILEAYPLPVSASFIAAEIDPDYFGNEDLMREARSILELDNVETAAHAFTHPLHWQSRLTSFEVPGYSKHLSKLYTREQIEKMNYREALVYPDSSLVTADEPTFLGKEIAGAVQSVNRLVAPEGKPVSVFQWSGNTRPPAAGLALCDELGVRNINGGDTQLDRGYPSYTGVAPLARQAGGYLQVYSSNSNEYIYTDGLEGLTDGYSRLVETFDQTEIPTLIDGTPRRVNPVNVYYHFYSGEFMLSLKALRAVYEDVMRRELILLFTSEYIDVVHGFYGAAISETGDGGWRFRGYGDCRTVRFDGEKRSVDLERSKGILGFRRWEGYLYVHLAEEKSGEKNAVVLYLTDEKQTRPYLSEASEIMKQVCIGRDEITFSTRIFREGIYRFANLPPDAKFVLDAKKDGGAEFQKRFRCDAGGNLETRLGQKGRWDAVLRREA